jgi:hypothetical protein
LKFNLKTEYICFIKTLLLYICLIIMKKDFSWTKDDNNMIFNLASSEELKRQQKKKPRTGTLALAHGGVSFQTSSGEGRYVSGTCPCSHSNEYSVDMSTLLSPKPHHQYRETATASRQEIRNQRLRQSSPAKALDKSRTGPSRGLERLHEDDRKKKAPETFVLAELEDEGSYESMTVPQLKAELRTRKLSTAGLKKELLERLHGNDERGGGGYHACCFCMKVMICFR